MTSSTTNPNGPRATKSLALGAKLARLGALGLGLLTAFSCNRGTPVAAGPHQQLTVAELLKREQACQLSGGEPRLDTAKYVGVRNAAYAYGYSYPKNFREVIIENLDANGVLLSDTACMVSPDKHASLKIWIGETISFPLGAINRDLQAADILRADSQVEKAIFQIKQHHYPYLQGASTDFLCHGFSGYNHSISLLSHNSRQVIIYKIVISELPVSGDLIFKNFVFAYDKGFEEQYHAVGVALANDFGDPF